MNPRRDKFDLAILRKLQADGRLSGAELPVRPRPRRPWNHRPRRSPSLGESARGDGDGEGASQNRSGRGRNNRSPGWQRKEITVPRDHPLAPQSWWQRPSTERQALVGALLQRRGHDPQMVEDDGATTQQNQPKGHDREPKEPLI